MSNFTFFYVFSLLRFVRKLDRRSGWQLLKSSLRLLERWSTLPGLGHQPPALAHSRLLVRGRSADSRLPDTEAKNAALKTMPIGIGEVEKRRKEADKNLHLDGSRIKN